MLDSFAGLGCDGSLISLTDGFGLGMTESMLFLSLGCGSFAVFSGLFFQTDFFGLLNSVVSLCLVGGLPAPSADFETGGCWVLVFHFSWISRLSHDFNEGFVVKMEKDPIPC